MSESRCLFPTHTGRLVDPLAMTPSDIDPADIAHSLAHQNRYAGHGSRPYSVLEHTFRIYQALSLMGVQPTVCLQGLLHDAHEAYVTDLPHPLKSGTRLGTEYVVIENRAAFVVRTRFRCPVLDNPLVSKLDFQIRRFEGRMLGFTFDPKSHQDGGLGLGNARDPEVDSALATLDWGATIFAARPRMIASAWTNLMVRTLTAIHGTEKADSIMKGTLLP